MKADEIINAMHNTIDYNKKEILDLLKKGTINLKMEFTINADEVMGFNIKCEKIATNNFQKLVPIMPHRYCLERKKDNE